MAGLQGQRTWHLAHVLGVEGSPWPLSGETAWGAFPSACWDVRALPGGPGPGALPSSCGSEPHLPGAPGSS